MGIDPEVRKRGGVMGLFKPNVKRMLERKDLPGLIKALGADHFETRQAATEALRQIGAPALEPLTAALRDRGWSARPAAARALGEVIAHSRDSALRARAIETLVATLEDQDRSVRTAAAATLGRVVDPDQDAPLCAPVTEALIAALEDRDTSSASGAAATALAQVAGRSTDSALGARAIEALTAALHGGIRLGKDDTAQVLGAVGGTVAQLGDTAFAARIADELIQLARMSFSSVRQAMESPREIPGMILMRGPYVDLGPLNTALVATGRMAIEPLLAALKDDDQSLRQFAAGVLGQIRDPRSVEPLAAALQDADPDVRRNAASALGQIGDPRALEPLEIAAIDREEKVRQAAAEALGTIRAGGRGHG